MNITTERLRLRKWTDHDRQPFAGMSADPDVMKFMMPHQSEKAFGAWIDDQINHMREHGFCFWAVERKEDAAFICAVTFFIDCSVINGTMKIISVSHDRFYRMITHSRPSAPPGQSCLVRDQCAHESRSPPGDQPDSGKAKDIRLRFPDPAITRKKTRVLQQTA